VTFLKENGWMTKPMVMVSIYMSMVLNMKVSGKTIFRMVMELRHGPTDQNFKENTWKAKSMEKGSIFGPTVASMRATG